MSDELMAPVQVIDAYFLCSLSDAEVEFLADHAEFEELYAWADECAKALGLVSDGIGNWYPTPGVRYRDLTGGRA